MINLGKKMEVPEAVPEPKREKERIDYPSLRVRGRDLGIDEDMAGKKIKAVVELRVERVSTSSNSTADNGKKKSHEYSFDVLSIEFKDNPKKDTQRMIEDELDKMEDK